MLLVKIVGVSASTAHTWRKLLVWLHVVASVSWLSQAAAMGVLVVHSATSAPGGTKVAAAQMAHVLDLTVLVASAITAATTGLGLSAVTAFGFFQHRWVTTKFVLTFAQIGIGTGLVAPAIVELGDAATLGRDGPWVLAVAGLAVVAAGLAFQVWVSIAKPWGRTAHGDRSRGVLRTGPAWVVAMMFIAPLLDLPVLAVLGFPLPVFALTGLALALRVRRHSVRQRAAHDREPASSSVAAAC